MLAHVVPPMVLRVTETIWARRTPTRERDGPTKTPDPFLSRVVEMKSIEVTEEMEEAGVQVPAFVWVLNVSKFGTNQ